MIPGSNAIDLFREALVSSKQNYGKPSGWGEFLQPLREAKDHRLLFGNKKTLRKLQ